MVEPDFTRFDTRALHAGQQQTLLVEDELSDLEAVRGVHGLEARTRVESAMHTASRTADPAQTLGAQQHGGDGSRTARTGERIDLVGFGGVERGAAAEGMEREKEEDCGKGHRDTPGVGSPPHLARGVPPENPPLTVPM